jgi:hypothetical protein
MDRPLLYYSNKVISNVSSLHEIGAFSSIEEFNKLLVNLPPLQDKLHLQNHDKVFISNLKSAMLSQWNDTKKPPLRSAEWINLIQKGNGRKKTIMDKVYGEGCGNSSVHWIRRHLLNNGFKDNINNPNTEYFHESNPNTLGQNLFSFTNL